MTEATLQARAADLAMLAWLVDLGADEAIGNEPLDRFAPPVPDAPLPRGPAPAPGPVAPPAGAGLAGTAAQIAAGCPDLASLRAAVAGFEGCALKRGARTCVFADGLPGAHVMIVGEAPGRDEDREGLPFVGRSGQLLDRMLAAIGLARASTHPARAVYITNVLPWRPPENREPGADEVAMMTAFLRRHIELARPRLILLMGRTAASALLGTTAGITRARGQWGEVLGRPTLPTFHPAALLRNPVQKREVWADLLSLAARLEEERGR